MTAPGDDTAADMLALSERLAAGARTLAGLPEDLRRGATACEQVLAVDGVRLLRFASPSPRPGLAPLLLVYSLVNRPYMLDLEPGRSFLRGVLDAGHDVHLVAGGTPRPEDRDLGLDDYVVRYLDACVSHLRHQHGCEAVDLVGVCQGGTFALCHAALAPRRVRRLALLVTPVDFHVPGFLLSRWMTHVDVDRLVDTLGNVPGSLLNRAFLALKPLSLGAGKGLDLLEIMHRPDALATFARMEQWLADNPDQAGRAFREFAHGFMRDNALVKGDLHVGGHAVDLGRLRAPVLNVYASRDHIVPPASSRALGALLPAAVAYTEAIHEGGHVGVFASRAATARVPRLLAGWLQRES